MIETGHYVNLSASDYHADKESVSRSSLMYFKRSPYYYWSKVLNEQKPTEDTKASLEFGNAFHLLVLEPHLFEKTYIVEPLTVLLKDVGREYYDEYKRTMEYIKNSSLKSLSHATFDTLGKMKESLYKNESAVSLLKAARYHETSLIWKDESGLMLKSRPDILTDNAYIDLKTCETASACEYQRSMSKYGYHIQAAMVTDGYKALLNEDLMACINICVEKTYPYSVGIYIIDELAIEMGRQEYKQLCLDLKIAIDHNAWRDYEIETVGLPRWYA